MDFFLFFFGLSFLSFLHHSKRKLFCSTLCSVCILSPLPFLVMREEEAFSRFSKEEETKRLSIVAFV